MHLVFFLTLLCLLVIFVNKPQIHSKLRITSEEDFQLSDSNCEK